MQITLIHPTNPITHRPHVSSDQLQFLTTITYNGDVYTRIGETPTFKYSKPTLIPTEREILRALNLTYQVIKADIPRCTDQEAVEIVIDAIDADRLDIQGFPEVNQAIIAELRATTEYGELLNKYAKLMDM